MREFYKDFYGCVASINYDERFDAGYKLVVLSPRPALKVIHEKVYDTRRGARIAMGKISDGWYKAGQWD